MRARANKVVVSLLLLALFMVWSSRGDAATFYVAMSGADTNAGSAASPWRTIAKAARAMQAGDTTMIGPGNYGESVDTVRGGTNGMPITFRAAGQAVTQTFNVAHPHITIDGFEMTAANVGYMMTISGSYCELLNNTIHDTGATYGIVRMSGGATTGCRVSGNRYYDATHAIEASADRSRWRPIAIEDCSHLGQELVERDRL